LREPTIARNYAQALFQAAEPGNQTERFAAVLEALVGAIEADERVRQALDSPRVPKQTKVRIVERALAEWAPERFVRFVVAVVRRGRQDMLGAISRQYQQLVDVKFNRVHASVTLARPADAALREEVQRRLSAALGKDVVPHFHENPALLGGVLVRVGDRVMDGSLRRRLKQLRRQMLGG
jgi:F-type H+-transporting ATPase subunit delta